MRSLTNQADGNGKPTSAIPFSDTVHAVVLAPNVAKTITVPAEATSVVFSATANFFAALNEAAAVPTADSTDAAVLNPAARVVAPGDTISVISST